ncbi:hypothetical protein MG296_04795 [Flavobacteriaceae bacterium TK19130]|nr:hypothetical protein [Thermobacterium salinum]
MAANNQDEIDLGKVSASFRRSFNGFLAWIYETLMYFLKRWYIVLGIIVLGIVLGYFMEQSTYPKKETELLVAINYNQAPYVYKSIDQLTYALENQDTASLRRIGFYKNARFLVKGIEIEPVVDVLEIMDDLQQSDRNMEVLIEQSQYEDDLLTSGMFYDHYDLHIIKLSVANDGAEETVQTVLDFFNKRELISRLGQVGKKNLERKIRELQLSVAYTDSILKRYGTVNDAQQANPNQVSFNLLDLTNNNMHLLSEEKERLLDRLEDLEANLAMSDDTVVVVNDPLLTVKKGLLSNKMVSYPFAFLFIYLVVLVILYFLNLGKQYSKEYK